MGKFTVLFFLFLFWNLAQATSTTLFKPADEGKFEIGVDFTHQAADSYRDSVRTKRQFSGNYSHNLAALRATYCFTDQIEVNAGLPYLKQSLTDDSNSVNISGIGSPSIGIKTSAEDFPVAFFMEIGLPLGDSEIVTEDPVFNALTGLLLDYEGKSVIIRAALSYQWRPGNDQKYDPGDLFSFRLQPGYAIHKMITIEGLLSYTHAGSTTIQEREITRSGPATIREKEITPAGFDLSIGPGMIVNMSDVVRMEVLIPYSVAGENSYSLSGAALSVSFWPF